MSISSPPCDPQTAQSFDRLRMMVGGQEFDRLRMKGKGLRMMPWKPEPF